MKKIKPSLTLTALLLVFMLKNAEAQHQTDGMKGMQMGDTSAKMSMQMSSGHSLNLPMNRDGSGTATL
jgi:hypothetical protein